MYSGAEVERTTTSWVIGMFGAARFLALGSFILLLVSLAVPFGVFLFSYTPIAGTAIALHFLGWVKLGDASRRSRSMTWTFRGSVLGFAVGITTLPFVPIPPFPDPFGNISPGVVILGGFAFVPSVFGPVVLAHALLFFLGSRSVEDGFANLSIAAGSIFLGVDATFAMLAQGTLVSLDPVTVLTFSGLTGIGYGLAAIGWHRLSRVLRIDSEIAGSQGTW